MAASSVAQAERRIALVIGNSAYQNTPELKNPKNDATDMAASLRRLGFEVFEGHDLDKRSMERMIRQFGVKLSGADLALFFYAGHGVAIGGQNYLVPVDARLSSEGDADFEGLPLTLVLKQMEREAKTSIVLLDACRDNPLARNLARTMGTRSPQVSQGLGGGEDRRRHADRLLDPAGQRGDRRHGPQFALRRSAAETYRGARHRRQRRPHRRAQRRAQGNRRQAGSVGAHVAHRPGLSEGRAASTPARLRPPATYPGNSDRDIELSYWNSVKDSKSPALLQSYLDRYPSGNFANLARAMIKELGPAAALRTAGSSAALPETKSSWCARCKPSCSGWAAIRAPSTANGKARQGGR